MQKTVSYVYRRYGNIWNWLKHKMTLKVDFLQLFLFSFVAMYV